MGLLRKLTEIDEEFLNRNGISSISILMENTISPRIIIGFSNGEIKAIKNIEVIKLLSS